MVSPQDKNKGSKPSSVPYLGAILQSGLEDVGGGTRLKEERRSRQVERPLQTAVLVCLSLPSSLLVKPNKEEPSFCTEGP